MIVHKNKTKNKPINFTWHIEDTKLEVVKNYNYLGLRFDSSTSWHAHIDNTIVKYNLSTNAINSLYKKNFLTDIRNIIIIYNAKTINSVLYGVEVWGTGNHIKLGTAENKFWRGLFGLPNATVIDALFLDLDIRDIRATVEFKIYTYFYKFWEENTNKLRCACIREMFSSEYKFKTAEYVKLVAEKYQLPKFWTMDDYSICGYRNIKEKFKIELFKIHYTQCSSKSSLSNFIQIKTHAGILKIFENSQSRIITRFALKLRYTLLPVNFVTQSWHNISKDKRTCYQCKDQIDDYHHFFSTCPFLQDIRNKWLNEYCTYDTYGKLDAILRETDFNKLVRIYLYCKYSFCLRGIANF